MKFLLDEGVTVSAGHALAANGHEVIFFRASGLAKGAARMDWRVTFARGECGGGAVSALEAFTPRGGAQMRIVFSWHTKEDSLGELKFSRSGGGKIAALSVTKPV